MSAKSESHRTLLAFGLSAASNLAVSSFGGFTTKLVQRRVTKEEQHQANWSRRVVVYCGRRGGRDYKRRGDGRRPNRVGELIRREISSIIDEAFARTFVIPENTSPVFVSVVDVRCSDDLRNARVNVSVLGSDEQKKDAIQWLRESRKQIRYELAQCVNLKYVPELMFAESQVAQAVKTVNILNMLAEDRKSRQASTGGDSLGSTSLVSEQGLDLDASADDAIILDDLEDEDDASEAHIIDVTEEDDLESLSDDEVREMLFRTLNEDDIAR